MAGGASLGDLGRRRVVRIVTVDARVERIVKTLDDLREAGRPRRQILMTVEAHLASLSRNDDGCLFVLGMGGRGTVADFAGQLAMVGTALDLDLVVAFLTQLPPAVPYLLTGDGSYGVGAIVSCLAERLRDKPVPGQDEDRKGDDQQYSQPHDLIRQLPKPHASTRSECWPARPPALVQAVMLGEITQGLWVEPAAVHPRIGTLRHARLVPMCADPANTLRLLHLVSQVCTFTGTR